MIYVNALTLSDASVSGTDAEAMSGGFVVASFAGAGLVSDLSRVVGIVKIFSGAGAIHAGLPALEFKDQPISLTPPPS
jgi:hypothetical protein